MPRPVGLFQRQRVVSDMVRRLVLVLLIAIVAAAVACPRKCSAPQGHGDAARRARRGGRGGPVRLALKVSLPEGLHTQSNKPRDATLIPTVLTIDAPAGVTVDEIVYPAAVDLKQEGLDEPLVVFEREFLIGVQVTLARRSPRAISCCRPTCATRRATT